MSHNLDLALKYAERSFHVFPCVGHGEKGKHPCPGVFWRSQSTIDTEQIRQWWERWPDAVPALDLDKCGLLALDCDVRDGVRGYDWAREKIGSLDGIPGSRTPSGGQHSIFRNDRDFGNSRGRLPGKEVFLGDVKGKGGYIIAPGARLKEGGYYEPIGDLADAPPIPETLVWYLTPEQPVASAVLARPQIARTITTTGKKTPWALGTMKGMVRDIAGAMPGDRNNMAWRKACKAGRMVLGGLFTYSEALAYLTDGAVQLGLPPKDRVFGPNGALVRGIERGFSEGPAITGSGDSQDAEYDQFYPFADDFVARGLAKQEVLARDAEAIDPETGEVLDEDEPAQSPGIAFLPSPGDWLHPEGVIGEIASYILSTSRYPNRPLSIAAATAVVSALCGRHLYGPTGSALNLYIVMLANTAVGKDRPLSAPYALLRAAGYSELTQTAKAFSVSAVEQMLAEHPCCLALADEIGPSLLARMSHKYAKAHEIGMRAAILELWARSYGKGPFSTTRRAKSPGIKAPTTTDIPSPSLTLLGASTYRAFYDVIGAGSVDDGFLNRFLLVEAAPRGEPQEVPPQAYDVPEVLAKGLAELVPAMDEKLAGDIAALLGVFHIDAPLAKARIERQVPWAEGMPDVIAAFERTLLVAIDANERDAPLLGRVFETSVRLATLHAVSRAGRMAEVTAPDWQWGQSMALASARTVIDGVGKHMSESNAQEVARAVKWALVGRGRVRGKDLINTLDHKYWAREVKEAIAILDAAGQIKVEKSTPGPKGGRPAFWYTWRV